MASLDGLRAFSITAVLLSHLGGTAGFGITGLPTRLGGLGVDTFFVVSGFLITSLLLKELAATGAVSLRAFYIRRTMRILPAFYVFAAAIVLLEALGVLTLRPGDALAAFTHTMNFRARREWWLGHTYSLSIQEQFYLLWPIVIAFLGAGGGLRMALGAILVAPLFRVALFYGWPAQRPLVDQAFPAIFDGLATGCALAILRSQLWSDNRYRRLLESPLFALVPAIVLVVHLCTPSVGMSLLFGQTVVNVGIALCIDWAMRFPDSWMGRVLNARPVIWVGNLSYSLYIWQQLFLCRMHPAWYTTFPLNLLLAVAAAGASYYLLELPILRVRDRWLRELARRRPPASAPGGACSNPPSDDKEPKLRHNAAVRPASSRPSLPHGT